MGQHEMLVITEFCWTPTLQDDIVSEHFYTRRRPSQFPIGSSQIHALKLLI